MAANSSMMKINVEELESGMVTADNVIEPGTDRVLRHLVRRGLYDMPIRRTEWR